MATSSVPGVAVRSANAGSAVHDFDFYMGSWRVHHHQLKERLAGNDEWREFESTSVAFPLLDGAGNVDDNVLFHPNGTYRAVSMRSFDPETGGWSIWWLDGRRPGHLDPPGDILGDLLCRF